jgi:hypothetical protein
VRKSKRNAGREGTKGVKTEGGYTYSTSPFKEATWRAVRRSLALPFMSPYRSKFISFISEMMSKKTAVNFFS